MIGNPAHDLIRLGLSLASSARGSDLPGVTTARMLEALVAGYETALTGERDAKLDRPREMRKLVRRSVKRRGRHLADDRLGSTEPVFARSRRFWSLETQEAEGLANLLGSLAPEDLKRLSVLPDAQDIRLVDAAYWMKGCSSLGRLRYAVLVRGETPDGVRHRLLDIKEAVKTLAPRASDRPMPADDAERVVAGARALSPHLGDRMVSGQLFDRPVVLRALAPQDLKIEIATIQPERAVNISAYLGAVVGQAHALQLIDEDRRAWASVLGLARGGGLDAPSWLWASVVELMSIHEAAYLEHCRRYVLQAV